MMHKIGGQPWRRNECFEKEQHMVVIKVAKRSQSHWLQVGISNQEECSRLNCTPQSETRG
jgi:hypothetical protein